ncbi:GNAT family N-acetyltransferase [Paenibacillus sp. CF384]|uniref:GNAT family N-acetyltransferase n=1 Tax=Paenibacillus sp. CF384 TaxID=1884382 RepID=UPI0008942136|nr:GNAT family N-acetyltransferase [Paenibacillus sp. CF384]SDW08731.1 Acetyltransferase (GNAT) domain-containing protein [Paenibacillus sp. CF384]
MEKEIRLIEERDYEEVHAFQCEYLDKETFEEFILRVKQNPDLYFVTVDGSEVVGICYGNPSKRNTAVINLTGIAVNLDVTKNYARVGLGTNMLRIFETAVKKRSYYKIGVGSADAPQVEAFYVKNGYIPTELVVKGSNWEEIARVGVDDYASGIVRREELRRQYNPREVIFILEKNLE